MKLTKLDHSALIVDDVERTRHFYGTVLGLEEVPRPSSFTFGGCWFRGPDFELHFILAADTTTTAGFGDPGPGGRQGLRITLPSWSTISTPRQGGSRSTKFRLRRDRSSAATVSCSSTSTTRTVTSWSFSRTRNGPTSRRRSARPCGIALPAAMVRPRAFARWPDMEDLHFIRGNRVEDYVAEPR